MDVDDASVEIGKAGRVGDSITRPSTTTEEFIEGKDRLRRLVAGANRGRSLGRGECSG
jgi:hypothetical protein